MKMKGTSKERRDRILDQCEKMKFDADGGSSSGGGGSGTTSPMNYTPSKPQVVLEFGSGYSSS